MAKKEIRVPVGADVTVEPYHATAGFLKYGYRESVYVDGSSIDGIIKNLKRIQKEHGAEYTDMSIETHQDCGCYGDCSCSPSLYVAGTRLENDVEYEHRLSEEKRRKEQQDERDRKDYERLHERFGEK